VESKFFVPRIQVHSKKRNVIVYHAHLKHGESNLNNIFIRKILNESVLTCVLLAYWLSVHWTHVPHHSQTHRQRSVWRDDSWLYWDTHWGS